MASVWGRPRSKSSCKENSSERAWPVTEEQALGLICMSPPTHTHMGGRVWQPRPHLLTQSTLLTRNCSPSNTRGGLGAPEKRQGPPSVASPL